MKTIMSRKTIDSNGRIHWVDGVKGISIYLIMVGHLLNSSNDVVLNKVIYSFHIPVFLCFLGIHQVLKKKSIDIDCFLK